MISGAHFVMFSKDAEADRAFFRTSSVSAPSMPVMAG
jgi:hypothetical protein